MTAEFRGGAGRKSRRRSCPTSAQTLTTRLRRPSSARPQAHRVAPRDARCGGKANDHTRLYRLHATRDLEFERGQGSRRRITGSARCAATRPGYSSTATRSSRRLKADSRPWRTRAMNAASSVGIEWIRAHLRPSLRTRRRRAPQTRPDRRSNRQGECVERGRACPSVDRAACDFGLVEVLELVADDLPVADGVDEPVGLHGRDFTRLLRRVDQSIDRADPALPEVLQLARSSETSRLSGPPRSSGSPSSAAPPPPYHARTASIPRSVVTLPRSGTTHSTSSARTSSTASRSKFAARHRLTTSIASLPTTRAYVLCLLDTAEANHSSQIRAGGETHRCDHLPAGG